jgi:hypothetical protein
MRGLHGVRRRTSPGIARCTMRADWGGQGAPVSAFSPRAKQRVRGTSTKEWVLVLENSALRSEEILGTGTTWRHGLAYVEAEVARRTRRAKSERKRSARKRSARLPEDRGCASIRGVGERPGAVAVRRPYTRRRGRALLHLLTLTQARGRATPWFLVTPERVGASLGADLAPWRLI